MSLITQEQIKVGDANLSILMAGTGEAVVLILSWARGADDFTDLMKTLAKYGYRAIAVNPRGIESSGSLAGVTIHDLAADVAGIIESLKVAPVHVLGHAFGNKTARCLAADYPELVSSVILLAAGGEVEPDPVALAALKSTLTESLSDSQWLSAMKKSHFFADSCDPRIWRTGWYPDVALPQLEASRNTPRDRWWQAGTAPILIIQGLDDVLAPPANGRTLHDKLGDRVQLVELKHTGHALLPEQPEMIAQTILDFLGDRHEQGLALDKITHKRGKHV